MTFRRNAAENSSAKSISVDLQIAKLLSLVSVLLLTGCDDRASLAPVVESRWLSFNTNQSVHRVQPGETLYAIAFRYDKDYRQLAAYNQLRSPYLLRVGQVVRIKDPAQTTAHASSGRASARLPSSSRYPKTQSSKSYYPIENHEDYHNMNQRSDWRWPAHGRVVAHFNPEQGKKGIDLAGKKGDAVYASAPGVVAYSGSGLGGYGNLIIIKHNYQFLTAYGHNARNLVHEGDSIKSGQRIADMGVIDRKFWGVHFEIRQAGQPVNPLKYLK